MGNYTQYQEDSSAKHDLNMIKLGHAGCSFMPDELKEQAVPKRKKKKKKRRKRAVQDGGLPGLEKKAANDEEVSLAIKEMKWGDAQTKKALHDLVPSQKVRAVHTSHLPLGFKARDKNEYHLDVGDED